MCSRSYYIQRAQEVAVAGSAVRWDVSSHQDLCTHFSSWDGKKAKKLPFLHFLFNLEIFGRSLTIWSKVEIKYQKQRTCAGWSKVWNYPWHLHLAAGFHVQDFDLVLRKQICMLFVKILRYGWRLSDIFRMYVCLIGKMFHVARFLTFCPQGASRFGIRKNNESECHFPGLSSCDTAALRLESVQYSHFFLRHDLNHKKVSKTVKNSQDNWIIFPGLLGPWTVDRIRSLLRLRYFLENGFHI